jgi:hypothetical protein
MSQVEPKENLVFHHETDGVACVLLRALMTFILRIQKEKAEDVLWLPNRPFGSRTKMSERRKEGHLQITPL